MGNQINEQNNTETQFEAEYQQTRKSVDTGPVIQEDMMQSIKKHTTLVDSTHIPLSYKKKKVNLARELIEWILYIAAAFVLASLIQSEVFALTEVNMSSMETTLIPRDKLMMNKLAYRFEEPKRGDILIFLKDESLSQVSFEPFERFIQINTDPVLDAKRTYSTNCMPR